MSSSWANRWHGRSLDEPICIEDEDRGQKCPLKIPISVADDFTDPEPIVFDLISQVKIPPGHVEINGYPFGSQYWLQNGVTVQLRDATFLRIKAVFASSTSADIYVKGILMKRNFDVEPHFFKSVNETEPYHRILPPTSDELCAIIRPNDGIHGGDIHDELVIEHLSQVLCVRRMVMTNNVHPKHPLYSSSTAYGPTQPGSGVLYCRWKCTIGLKKTEHGLRGRDWKVTRIPPDECDKVGLIPERETFQLFQAWRNEDRRRTAVRPAARRSRQGVEIVIDLTGDNNGHSTNKKNTKHHSTSIRGSVSGVTIKDSFRIAKTVQAPIVEIRSRMQSIRSADLRRSILPPLARNRTYTYADIMCGGGGSTVGAQQAGLTVKFALDHTFEACKTVENNITTCEVQHTDITEWLTDFQSVAFSGIEIDVLHVSFPCQAFSRANNGSNDESDQQKVDLAFALREIIEKIRPRVITMEQVDGILDNNKRSGHYLFAQMHTLTEMGYSFDCKVLNMADHGLAQKRRRIILIASCPGQRLPPFPAPTHGIGPGLHPPTTIADVLATIPPGETGVMAEFGRPDKPFPYDGRSRQMNTITCGPQSTHPSGTRSFTSRELATLQGFPTTYRFFGSKSDILRQIGNAVPPLFAEQLFRSIKRTLEETDAAFDA